MDWRGKKILVNGITGFIGSNLGRELLNRGAEVYSIDNFSYINVDIARKKIGTLLDRVKIIEGDISEDKTWARVPKDIEYIFHFASPSSITLFKENPEKCYKETVFGFWNVLEFAKENGVKRVVYPSSGSNYAGNEMPHHENMGVKPRNFYAAAKVACEGLASSYYDFVSCVGLRIFGGYGPGEEWKREFGSVLYIFIRDYMNGKAPEVWGDGSQTRDFIYVEDIVKAAVRAAEIDYKGVINVGTGRDISFKELLNLVKNSTGSGANPTFIPKDKNYIDNLKADTTLMKSLLGVETITPQEGVIKFINYLRNQPETASL
jgi:UDP-glucose 4-epimerase